MINVHLNGDIVRCPDIHAAFIRNQEIKDAHNICRYNIHENDCRTWQDSLMNWQSTLRTQCAGRCKLAGSILCPGHNRQKKTGSEKKTFKIDNVVYRKLASTAHYLVKESNYKVLFITLTFPPFKRKVSDNELNKYFSKYVENLRENYDCGGYIGVRERGKKNGRVHYHLLLSIPFVAFNVLNDTWCHTISDICNSSPNAVTSDPETRFINNPGRAMRYVCKYFSKTKGQVNDSRLVFISINIIQKAKHATGCVEDILTGYKSIYIQQTSDYTTLFRITDSREFDRFCNEFLYPFFEFSYKKTSCLYSFPLNTS